MKTKGSFPPWRTCAVVIVPVVAVGTLMSPLTSTAAPIVQEAYVKASNPGGWDGFSVSGDEFGYSVAMSGDTIVIGAHYEDGGAAGVNGNQNDNGARDSGAAYVFARSGTNWVQQAYLKASNPKPNYQFGWSVAISGDTIVVGSVQESSNATGVNGNQGDTSAGGSGAAYVFVRSGTNWTQQAYLKASNADAFDEFGISVAVSGDTIVVGARLEASNARGVNGNQSDNSAPGSGAAYVFVRLGTNWTQQAYLKASNTGGTATPDECCDGDEFGTSVAISSNTIVVGAYQEDSSATGVNGNQADNSADYSGAAYVFERSGTNWTQQAYLKASNTDAFDYFGWAVAISGSTVVVGAFGEDSDSTGVNGDEGNSGLPDGRDSGAVYVFARNGTNWTQQAYVKAPTSRGVDFFSGSVAVSGDTLVSGSHVFVRSWTNWTHQASLEASNADEGDWFGYSVAVSGDTVTVTALNEDSSATGVNGDQTDNSAVSSGAAYVFTPVCSVCPRLMLTRDGSGGYFIRFNGAPGVPYRLQRAPGFAGPWTTITTLAPPPSGHFEYHDTPPAGQAFYRTVQP